MKNISCTSHCVADSLKEMVSENIGTILIAMAIGAFYGLYLGYIWLDICLALIAILPFMAYGYMPQMRGCIGECQV